MKKERETHLETAQTMRQYQQSCQEMESSHQERLAELLSEQTETREQLESQAEALDLYREQNKRMETLLQEELGRDDEGGEGGGQGTGSGSVPRERFDELQHMFVETVERLTTRVMQLEEGRTGSGSGSGSGSGGVSSMVSQRGAGTNGGRYQPSAPVGVGSRKGPLNKGGVGRAGAGSGGFGVTGGGYGRR